jgi:mannose-6-phosphate isomerase-like protein (cupin superfamily)
MESSFKTITKRVLEAVSVLALVLLFFLVILMTLNVVFPTGESLFNLLKPGGDYQGQTSEDRRSRQYRLVTDTGEQVLGEQGKVTAVLSRMENTVKSKRAAQIAWQGAAKGMTFYDRDAIQTFSKSSATLTFKEGNFLELDENSLVVLRKLERDVFLRENRTVVVLIGGQLAGEVGKTEEESFNLEVVTPGAVARIQSPENKGQPARFQMTVKPDDSAILTVLEGTADLVIEGKPMEVGADQIVKIQPGKQPVYLSTPPRPPVLISPSAEAIYSFRNVPPMVSFDWEDAQGISDYHFVLAADQKFEEVIHEDTIGDSRFSHGNLKPGNYFWRVSSVNKDWEGRFSKVGRFQLIQDLEPPPLDVDFPGSPLREDVFELRGTTEPEARVFVGGIPVRINEKGEFGHTLTIQSGPNVILVEAVDKVGNVAYFSRIVHTEY